MHAYPLLADLLIGLGLCIGVSLALSAVMFPFVYLRNLRCRLVFRKWLKENRCEVLSHDERWYRHGPFSGENNRKASVSRLQIRDEKGSVRQAFVRCAAHKQGLFGRHELEFRWDDEPELRPSPGRLWAWLLLPFLSAGTFLVAVTLWLSDSRFIFGSADRFKAPLIVGGIAGLGIFLMIQEQRRGFPTLRRILAASREQFGPLILCHGLLCLGGFVQAGALLLFRGLSFRADSPDRDQAGLWILALFLAGNALFFVGLVLRNARLRALAPAPR